MKNFVFIVIFFASMAIGACVWADRSSLQQGHPVKGDNFLYEHNGTLMGVNWIDIERFHQQDVNWTYINPTTGGVNWTDINRTYIGS